MDTDIDISKLPSSIEEFFSAEELAKIPVYEKLHLSSLRQNYEALRKFGLPVNPPEFMLKKTSFSRKQKLSLSVLDESTDGSDSEWTPALEKIQTIERGYNKPFVPRFTSGLKRKSKNANQTTKRAKKMPGHNLKMVNQKQENHKYPLRSQRIVKYMSLAIPDDDDFLYCEECNMEYAGDCPVHGPLITVADQQVDTSLKGKDLDYCERTLPLSLQIRKSKISNAGLGVYALQDFSVRTQFGPYGGVKEYNEEIAHESGYCWQVYKDGKPSHFIDARNSCHSNWMRFVNCARSEDEQCLTAYQYKGEIYYRAHKPIPRGAELLVYYGDSYAKDLGISIQQHRTQSRQTECRKDDAAQTMSVNGVHACPLCKLGFSSNQYLETHMKRRHNEKHWLKIKDYILKKNLVAEFNCFNCCTEKKKSVEDVEQLYESLIKTKPIVQSMISKGEELFKSDGPDHDASQSQSMNLYSDVTHNGEGLVACSECNKWFSQESHHDKNSNMEQIKEGKMFKCNECYNLCSLSNFNMDTHMEQPFTNNEYYTMLGQHILLQCQMRTQQREQPFKYSECDKTFNQNSDFNTPHTRTHTGEKPFKCNECSKTFSEENGKLHMHMRTHAEKKTFKCNEYGKTFDQSSDLHSRMRTHTGGKPFKCDECSKTSGQSGHLHTHMTTHTGEKPFKCDECSKTSGQSGHLHTHMTTHTGEKPFKCDECSKTSGQSGDLHSHMRTHTGEKPFKCDECGKTSGQSGDLHSYMKTHTGEKPFKCKECGKTFNQNGNLHDHMKTHPGEKPFKCKECGKTFSQNGELHSHMRTHTGERPFKCKECGKTFSQSGNLHSHMKTHTEKSFKCKECGKTFSQNDHLHSHIRTHTGEKTFKCKECGKTFNRNDHLHGHMRTHTGEKPFKCKECGKTFSHSHHLHDHMRTHTGEKPFKCKECGKMFSRSCNLHDHMRTHTGEKPFKCKKCGKTFSQSGSLHSHMRTHTGEKPFKCKECGKTFSESCNLHDHMRTHTGEKPFKCKKCGKTFSQSGSLHSHMRTHTGEKPFKCKECGKTFSWSGSLHSHMRTHTGEKPFKCKECGKTFSWSGSLHTHMRTQHAERK